MQSPAISLPHHSYPYTEYDLQESSRFYVQQSTPPDDAFDDENQLPTEDEFKAIIKDYLQNLSPKKRDKALVDQQRYVLIQQVLRDPRNTAISTAQFRFWVKKMFQLQNGSMDIVCHDNKPVAIKEEIYFVLVKAHRDAHHGGRDKTSALVRRQYSWIPKELVARFVRNCPFCITRRNGGQSPSTFTSKTSSPRGYISRHSYAYDTMPQILCAPINEESDISSTGPSSTETGYNTSSNYVTITQSSSRRPYMNGIYGHGEDDFLHHYQYQPTLQSSFQPNLTFQQYSDNASPATMPSSHQPSLFYHHSTYMGYPSSSYPNSYYPNVLGIAPCNSETTTAAGASTVNAPEPGTITERGTRNDSHPTTAESFLRSANNGTDILAHHPEQQHYFGPSSTQFVPYASSNMTESPFATTDLR